MMTNRVPRLRQLGSLVAGVLIGLSIVVATIAVADNGHGGWPTLCAFAAPVILLVGFALQAFVTSRSGRGPAGMA
jgi:uncharacterized membrane protein (UPF0136 family)